MDISVSFAGVKFKNPIVAASGCFGFGREYNDYYDISKLGGICVKGLTLEPRLGNAPPRIAETPMGMLNSVGLQNPGVDAFIKDELPTLKKYDIVTIANISGNTAEEYAVMAQKLIDAGIDMIEVNVSCPNVRCGGMAFGTSPGSIAEVTEAVARVAQQTAQDAGKKSTPIIIKLSPNVTNIAEMAKAAESAGADAVSLINTLLGMRIDVATRRPVLNNNVGGLSGPAVFPVAVRMVWEVSKAVSIPVLGMGGVTTGNDAAEMMLAGANLIGVGTACISDPYGPVRIIDELKAYMTQNSIDKITDITGRVVIN